MMDDTVYVGVKLDPKAIKPTKAHDDDAAFDLYARHGFMVDGYSWVNHDTGVHMVIPKGYCGLIVNRSSMAVKHGLTTLGLVDSGYTGTITVSIHNPFEDDHMIVKGARIAQIMILPVPDVELIDIEEMPDTERGDKGFGSTGA